MSRCCGFVVQLVVGFRFVVDLLWLCCGLVDLLWICCTACCTTNPQQIRVVEFGFKNTTKYATFRHHYIHVALLATPIPFVHVNMHVVG